MIPAFQRSIVQNELRNRYKNWLKQETKDKFFGKFSSNILFEDFGIERDSSGYFYLSDNLIVYNDLKNGNIFRIKNTTDSKNWKCYNDLYQRSQDLGTFRIDKPIYRETITVKGSYWEYAELQSPGRDYGQNYNDEIFQWPPLIDGISPNDSITPELQDSIEEYYKEFIDQSSIIIQETIEVAENNSCGLPRNLCRPSTRFKDADGYFWSDFDQDDWNTSMLEFQSFSITIFRGTLDFIKILNGLREEQVSRCLSYASEKWKII